jgi:hypothetical protein
MIYQIIDENPDTYLLQKPNFQRLSTNLSSRLNPWIDSRKFHSAKIHESPLPQILTVSKHRKFTWMVMTLSDLLKRSQKVKLKSTMRWKRSAGLIFMKQMYWFRPVVGNWTIVQRDRGYHSKMRVLSINFPFLLHRIQLVSLLLLLRR